MFKKSKDPFTGQKDDQESFLGTQNNVGCMFPHKERSSKMQDRIVAI